jgi:hypothetical protein
VCALWAKATASRRWLRRAAIVSVIACLPARALAEDKTTIEAREHFSRALELVDAGMLQEAAVEFRRAYDISPNYAVLYNLGQAFAALGRPVEAVDAFERYLAEGGTRIRQPRRAEVDAELARQRSRIATLTLNVEPRDAAVRIDDQELGSGALSSPIRLAMGSHTLIASREGYRTLEREIDLTTEKNLRIDLELEVLPEPSPPRAAPAQPPAPSRAARPSAPTATTGAGADPGGWRAQKIVGFALSAAGVVGLGVGGALWLSAKSKHSDALGNCRPNCNDTARSLQSEAVDEMRLSTVVSIVSGVVLAGGVVLVLTAPAASPKPTPRYVKITPLVAGTSAGMMLNGAW